MGGGGLGLGDKQLTVPHPPGLPPGSPCRVQHWWRSCVPPCRATSSMAGSDVAGDDTPPGLSTPLRTLGEHSSAASSSGHVDHHQQHQHQQHHAAAASTAAGGGGGGGSPASHLHREVQQQQQQQHAGAASPALPHGVAGGEFAPRPLPQQQLLPQPPPSAALRLGIQLEHRGDVRRLVAVLQNRVHQVGGDINDVLRARRGGEAWARGRAGRFRLWVSTRRVGTRPTLAPGCFMHEGRGGLRVGRAESDLMRGCRRADGGAWAAAGFVCACRRPRTCRRRTATCKWCGRPTGC